MRDDADDFLPYRYFLRGHFARELLQQDQPVRLRIEHEASLRDVEDVGLRCLPER